MATNFLDIGVIHIYSETMTVGLRRISKKGIAFMKSGKWKPKGKGQKANHDELTGGNASKETN